MTNRVYDVLKFIAQIILPAVGTLYAALAGIWGFPYGEPIVATIMAVDTFLGAILGISKYRYDKEQDGWLSDYIEQASEGWKVTGRSGHDDILIRKCVGREHEVGKKGGVE